MFPASMRPATRLAIAIVLGQMATARADDLPPELVARPATLPHGVATRETLAATSELWVTEPGREAIEVFSVTFAPPAVQPSGQIAVPGGPESLVVDQTRGRAFTHLWDGGTVAVDVHTRAVGPRWSNGCNDSRRHLYAPGQISANTAIIGVSTSGELGLLAKGDGTLYGHCVTTDDAGQAFVADPRGGALLVIHDAFDAITR